MLSVDCLASCTRPGSHMCVSRTQGLRAQRGCEGCSRSGPAGHGGPGPGARRPASRPRHQPPAWGLLAGGPSTWEGPGASGEESADKGACWEPWSGFRTQLPCSHAIGPGTTSRKPPRTRPEGFCWEAIQSQLCLLLAWSTQEVSRHWNKQPQTRGLKTPRVSCLAAAWVRNPGGL